MRLATVLSWISLATLSTQLAAQTPQTDRPEAQPERPTVATHAGTVAPGWVELEAGAETDRFSDGSRAGVIPAVTKIGIARRLQLSIYTPFSLPTGGTAGVGDFGIGVKWRILNAAPVLGDFAILPAIKLPSGSTALDRGTGTTDFNLLLISSHKFREVAMDINVGYTRRSGQGTAAPRNASLWTCSFGGPARGPIGWVAEIYGYPGTSGPAGAPPVVAGLGGPSFEVRKWLVLDVGIIEPVRGPQPHAVYAGFTYNLGRLQK